MEKLNPESHLGQLMYKYYGTYDVNEIMNKSSSTESDYIPDE